MQLQWRSDDHGGLGRGQIYKDYIITSDVPVFGEGFSVQGKIMEVRGGSFAT